MLRKNSLEINAVMLVGQNNDIRKEAIQVIKNSNLSKHIVVHEKGHDAVDYLKSAYKRKSDYVIPEILFLDVQMQDMSGIEFLMLYNTISSHRRKHTHLYIHTSSRAPYIKSLPQVYDCVQEIIAAPLDSDSFSRVLSNRKSRHTWPDWIEQINRSFRKYGLKEPIPY